MFNRFLISALFGCALLVFPATASEAPLSVQSTQESQDLPVKPKAGAQAKPKPKPSFELAKDLNGLFVQLSKTRNVRRGERISEGIWEKWQTSDSRSVDLLTGWARKAASDKKFGIALDLLDQAIVLRPKYAEGYNQRATVHFIMSNFNKSIADIERTLAIEPRHYGALGGLAAILERIGNKKKALETWYRVLKIYPSMKSAQDSVVRLEEELAGSGI